MTKSLLALTLAVGFIGSSAFAEITPEEARKIAKEAYIYGFPMVVHYKVMDSYVLDETSPEYKAPFNQVACTARVYTPEDRAIVTPNSDTPYCFGFFHLDREPVVLKTPDVEEGRYFSIQLIDAFTHNFAYVGSIETGSEAGEFLLVGPNWDEDVPSGIDKVIESETDIVFATIRTQLFGPDDLERVSEIQAGYDIVPLEEYLGGAAKSPPILSEAPEWVEGAQFDARAFNYIDYMLDFAKPIEKEAALRERFAEIGIGTPGPYDLDSLDPEIRTALEKGVAAGFRAMEELAAEHATDPVGSAKVFGTREFLETSARENFGLDAPYLVRAIAAHLGLYGNSASEAIYPGYFVDASGKPLNAAEADYTLTFPAGSLPPVSAFWSLTMYDGQTQLLVDNPLNRYLLNSTMLDRYARGAGGSLTLYVRATSPGPELEPNWLPAPNGPFYVILRLYGPGNEALTGAWTPPQLEKSD